MKISKLVACGAIVLGGMAGGLVARSESNHHVELSGSACRSGGQTIVSYEAHSWDMGSAGGLNDAVKVEIQYTVGNVVLHAVVWIVIIYAVCTLIDMGRIWLLRHIRFGIKS